MHCPVRSENGKQKRSHNSESLKMNLQYTVNYSIKNIHTPLFQEEKIKSSQDAELLDILTNLRGPFVPQDWKNNLLLHPPASRPQ